MAMKRAISRGPKKAWLWNDGPRCHHRLAIPTPRESRGVFSRCAGSAYRARFPADFAFTIEINEIRNLMPQFAASSWGGRRGRTIAFTEHDAIMAATVLNSPRAVEMSVYVVRAFVKLREVLAPNTQLASKLDALENSITIAKLRKYDPAPSKWNPHNAGAHHVSRPDFYRIQPQWLDPEELHLPGQ
ncbi:MAG: ORF6N domain-containing protein [Steroidobacteraceae bacterium]